MGRDLQIGSAAAALFAVAGYVQVACHGPAGAPGSPALEALIGIRQSVFQLTEFVTNGLFSSVFFFFVFFVLRVLLRRQWLATVVFIPLTAFTFIGSPGGLWIDRPFHVFYAALLAFILLRFGLLALMVAMAVSGLLSDVPWTPDPSALNLVALGIAALIAVYGFRISLAGRPIFRGELL